MTAGVLDDGVHLLVTGGSGFLGSNIVVDVRRRYPRWKITVLDQNAPSPETMDHTDEFVSADVSSAESVSQAFSKIGAIDIVLHAAGVIPARKLRYSTDELQWERVKAINYSGAQNIVSAIMASNCRRLVYTSSCTVVADDLKHDYHNVDETVQTGLAMLHYGRSKILAEQHVLSPSHRSKGLKACALRPCTIIGEGDTAVISVMHDLIAKGETNFIVGDGYNMCDFMYISNAVDAHILAIENLLTTETAAGEVFFISNDEPVYFWDFLAFLWAQFGHVPRWKIYIPAAVAYFVGVILEWITLLTGTESTLDTGSVQDGIRTQYADISKAKEVLGYVPRVGISEGLRRSCEAYKRHLAANEKR
ncbi:related to ERG26 C-3 sterol dehydrogenase (C-4 decarboxylase) [Ramularia collo-cygni]|uniref:Related to ERG26 C-3 sterol dehydrogenase (C-4 decarboxylase) n=1 Tax=Ramularia collo-cygni TaxID=112498 RepID=A0A2D3UZV5_9PEZI|nr:related to ERG26 C-3 sterol dehydrogenase (C-4 decarboxylase) [Ramularia collo-cygni]CZT17947.1 related to ERG26 C-3 sterol dehydrogenase (C-4 decarboxylase) [Ramularia collo-cygni]